MTAIPVVYKSSDPGAPALSNYNNSLYEVVKSCLVDGYPGKDAAGWSVVYDEWAATGIATFKNAAESGVLGMIKENSNAYCCTLFVADAMVNAWTPVNARSGSSVVTDLSGLVAGGKQNRFGSSAGSFVEWVVVANNNFALVWTASSEVFLSDPSAYAQWSQLSFISFGSARNLRSLGGVSDALLGNFVIVGGYIGGAYSNGVLGVDKGCVLYDHTDAFSQSAVFQFLTPFGVNVTYPGAGDFASSLVHMDFEPVVVWDGSTTSSSVQYQLAKLPMLWTNYYLYKNYFDDIAPLITSDLFGASVSVAGKTGLLAPLPSGGGIFISMQAEDWL